MKMNQKRMNHGGLCAQFRLEYSVWYGMLFRCYNPKSSSWKWYGARGVKVCQRWRESFANFLADMGYRPSPKHQIDRYPDNSGDYEPGNCRWATVEEQQNNKRDNRKITIGEATLNRGQWQKKLNRPHSTFGDRIAKGIPVELAMVKGRHELGHKDRKTYTKNGITKTIIEWLQETGIGWPLFAARINQLGWDFERALFTPKRSRS